MKTKTESNRFAKHRAPTPDSLAGYQLVCSGVVEDDDLCLPVGWLHEGEWRWADEEHVVGFTTTPEGYLCDSSGRIYRRIDTPQHLGRDDTIEHALREWGTPEHKARTDDAGKPALAHLPWAAIDALANVQGYGAAKYGDFNNYRKGMEVTRNLSCALRHIRDYLAGHDRDHESGQSPLAHALARIAFVLQNEADGVAIDDRFKKPAAT